MLHHNVLLSIKNEIRRNLAISIPLALSQIIFACSGFIGTVMVAHLGREALAASVLVAMAFLTLSSMFFNLLNAVGVLVSHQHGAGNTTAIRNIMGQAYMLGAVVAVVLLVLMSCVPALLQWSGQPTEVLFLARRYMMSWLCAIPGLTALVITEQFLIGVGRAKIVLRLSCVVVPMEITLIYMLIFGKLGVPTCGIAGVGYGFAITYSTSAIFLLWYILHARAYRKYNLLAGFALLNLRYLKELFRVGVPMGLMSAIEVSTFAVATLWMGHFGTSMLAAHQVVLQYLNFAITLVFAMSQAVTIRIGHAVGAKDMQGVQYAVYVGILLNFVVVLLIGLTFILVPQLLIGVDINAHITTNKLLVQHTMSLLSICGVFLIFDNFRIIGFGALRGLKDTNFPMYASFVSFWIIALGSAYILAFCYHLEGTGIWWGLTIGIASGATIIMLRIRYQLRHVDLERIAAIKE